MSICFRRREFIAALGSVAAWPCIAGAQRRVRLPLIGVFWGPFTFPMANFRQGLADQGLVIGENVAIDFEFPTQFERFPAHAAELVERRVDVIFVGTNSGMVRAAKSATTTIPIVFLYGGEPVEDGFVASLGRPGGNVTGMTTQTAELTGKRLGLLHELVPGATTIAFLTGPNPGRASPDRVRAAAHSLGLNVLIFAANNDREVERAFTEMTEQLVQTLIIDNVPVANGSSRRIIELAERHKIPAIYPFLYQARTGGLISYDSIYPTLRDLAARYVAPIILKSAKPADLPVQQPTKFALVINMKAAKAVGVTIPQTLFAIADEVIE
jgi:putative ABC transport system substrate-binding protein